MRLEGVKRKSQNCLDFDNGVVQKIRGEIYL